MSTTDTQLQIWSHRWNVYLEGTELNPLIRTIAQHNPSANAPYHNTDHMVAVAKTAHILLRHTEAAGLRVIDSTDRLVVVLAALIHDFDHSTRSDAARPNIAQAIAGGLPLLEPYLASHVQRPNAAAQITALVEATYYPKEGHGPLPPTPAGWTQEQFQEAAMILRDADILSALLPESQRNTVLGLRIELSQDLPQPPALDKWVGDNCLFHSKQRQHTASGRWFFRQRAAIAFRNWSDLVVSMGMPAPTICLPSTQ